MEPSAGRAARGRRGPGLSPAGALALLYAVLTAAGTLALMTPWATREGIGVLDAAFTAVSAVTVTGLTVADTGSTFTLLGQAVILALIQAGGLGLMTFTVMVLHALGMRLTLRHRLYLCEDLNRPSVGEVRTLAKAIILAVLAVEAAGMAVLALRWVPEMGWAEGLWFSLFHAVSATNNAGFALRADGMAPWAGDPIVNLALPLLFIVGGLGFGVLADLREERRWARLSLHTKLTLAATGVCLLIGPAAFALLEWSNPRTLGGLESAADRLWAAWFQGTSIRTAGFASVDHAGMTDPTWLVSVILMLVGGGSTSTAGGVKVTTAAVALLAAAAFLRRRQAVVAFGRTIPPEDVAKVTALILLTFALCVLGTFLLTALDGIPLREAAFEAASALSTTGASLGATTATGTAGRMVLIALMLVGKLGPLTAALLLTAPKEAKVKPPPGRVFIG